MKRIVLTEEQAKHLSALEPVEICDPRGNVVASIAPVMTPDELARIRRARDCQGPWLTGEQVRQTLQQLDEAWQREGPFDKDRLQELLQEIRAAPGWVMPYHVDWSPAAEADLADGWLKSSDRLAITRAQHRLDRLLAADPHQGRYLSEDLYRLHEGPLVAYDEIDDQTRTVRVTNVDCLS